MATYIQGITDYIPKLQPFQPDFNFFQKALEVKQQQYDAGYNKISALYGDLLNSSLMRQPNIDRRNEFFTDVDNEIKRLSGVDLSLQENITAAKSIFQPLIDNPYFRKDMVFTKSYQKAKSIGERLRSNPDPKSEVKWWAEGDRALDYQAEDFSKSSDEESLGFSSNLKYVPFVDTATKLFQFAKDNDINPESLTKEGGYFVKMTNGQLAIPRLHNVFSTVLMNDPRVKDMFSTQAYLDRKNYMKSNAEKFQGDEFAAETEYLKTKVDEINAYYRKVNELDQKDKDQATTKKKAIESVVRTKGIDPDLDKDLIDMYQGTVRDEQITSAVVDKNTEALSQTDMLDFDGMDRQSLRFRVDNAQSFFLMDEMATKTAADYAGAKQKIDLEADVFALENLRHSHNVSLEGMRQDFEKKMKIMDIAQKLMENNGTSVPGMGNPIMDMFNNGTLVNIPGAGNVSLSEIDIQARGGQALANIEKTQEKFVQSNMDLFLQKQNAIITNPNSTQDQKNLAAAEVEKVLGVYEETKEAGYSYTEELPVDWGTGLKGAGKVVGGGILLGLSGLAEGLSAGIATPLVIGGVTLGAGVAASGAGDVMEGFAGTNTVNVPEKIVGTKGFARKKADGTYELVVNNKGFSDPNSNDYSSKVNDRINAHMAEYAPYDKKTDPAYVQARLIMDANNGKILENKSVIDVQKEILKSNNGKIAAALANESGIDNFHTDQFFLADKSRPKTEQEYIEDYVKAHKDDFQYYPRTNMIGGDMFKYDVRYTDEERYEQMREDAADKYEDLKEGYETLSKNPGNTLGLQAFDPDLLNKGVNAFMGTAARYAWDPVAYNSESFRMLADLYNKDLKPAIDSDAFRNQVGGKFMFGNGFNITKDDYDEAENSDAAARVMNFAIASGMMNYGGKPDQHPNRPKGFTYYHSVAANDATKVAVTMEFDNAWVDANKGSKDAPGPTWELSQKMASGDLAQPQITFFINADAAQSSPFQAMQMTTQEFLLQNGKLNLAGFEDKGGSINYSRNALGGISYSGYAKSYNQLGELVTNPIFGSLVNGEDINSVYRMHNDMLSQISEANLMFEQAMAQGNNSVKDPSVLQNQQ